jgi:hypothetical protein
VVLLKIEQMALGKEEKSVIYQMEQIAVGKAEKRWYC